MFFDIQINENWWFLATSLISIFIFSFFVSAFSKTPMIFFFCSRVCSSESFPNPLTIFFPIHYTPKSQSQSQCSATGPTCEIHLSQRESRNQGPVVSCRKCLYVTADSSQGSRHGVPNGVLEIFLFSMFYSSVDNKHLLTASCAEHWEIKGSATYVSCSKKAP